MACHCTQQAAVAGLGGRPTARECAAAAPVQLQDRRKGRSPSRARGWSLQSVGVVERVANLMMPPPTDLWSRVREGRRGAGGHGAGRQGVLKEEGARTGVPEPGYRGEKSERDSVHPLEAATGGEYSGRMGALAQSLGRRMMPLWRPRARLLPGCRATSARRLPPPPRRCSRRRRRGWWCAPTVSIRAGALRQAFACARAPAPLRALQQQLLPFLALQLAPCN